MLVHFILFILAVGVIMTSAMTLSSAKKYLRSPDKSCFGSVHDRFCISRVIFILMLAVPAFMLIFDLHETVFFWLMLFAYMIDTVHFIIPLLYFGSLLTAAFLWIYCAIEYSEVHKVYQIKVKKTT